MLFCFPPLVKRNTPRTALFPAVRRIVIQSGSRVSSPCMRIAMPNLAMSRGVDRRPPVETSSLRQVQNLWLGLELRNGAILTPWAWKNWRRSCRVDRKCCLGRVALWFCSRDSRLVGFSTRKCTLDTKAQALRFQDFVPLLTFLWPREITKLSEPCWCQRP
jgi:hypothetical protein